MIYPPDSCPWGTDREDMFCPHPYMRGGIPSLDDNSFADVFPVKILSYYKVLNTGDPIADNALRKKARAQERIENEWIYKQLNKQSHTIQEQSGYNLSNPSPMPVWPFALVIIISVFFLLKDYVFRRDK